VIAYHFERVTGAAGRGYRSSRIRSGAAALRSVVKSLQLVTAAEVGLAVLRTLCSSDPARIRAFIRENAGETIYKPFCATQWRTTGGSACLFTAVIDESELPDDDVLRLSPGIFQPRIAKAYELRVTMMGRHVFAAELASQSVTKAQAAPSSDSIRGSWHTAVAQLVPPRTPARTPTRSLRGLDEHAPARGRRSRYASQSRTDAGSARPRRARLSSGLDLRGALWGDCWMRRAIVVAGMVLGAACKQPEPSEPLKLEEPAVAKAVVEPPSPMCKACPAGRGPPGEGDLAVIQPVRKLLALCGSSGEGKWRVDYVVPGRDAYIQDQIFTGGEATKKCLSDQLAAFEWPAGYRAKVVAYSEVDREMSEETLRTMNALYDELEQCRKDGSTSEYEFDLNVKDGSGSTVTNAMFRIGADEQACFLAAVGRLRPPQPWSLRLKLTRGDGPFDDP
jgi:hypothetical protein